MFILNWFGIISLPYFFEKYNTKQKSFYIHKKTQKQTVSLWLTVCFWHPQRESLRRFRAYHALVGENSPPDCFLPLRSLLFDSLLLKKRR